MRFILKSVTGSSPIPIEWKLANTCPSQRYLRGSVEKRWSPDHNSDLGLDPEKRPLALSESYEHDTAPASVFQPHRLSFNTGKMYFNRRPKKIHSEGGMV